MLVGVTKGKTFAACVCGYTISEAYSGDIAVAMERIEAEAKANHRCNAARAIKGNDEPSGRSSKGQGETEDVSPKNRGA